MIHSESTARPREHPYVLCDVENPSSSTSPQNMAAVHPSGTQHSSSYSPMIGGIQPQSSPPGSGSSRAGGFSIGSNTHHAHGVHGSNHSRRGSGTTPGSAASTTHHHHHYPSSSASPTHIIIHAGTAGQTRLFMLMALALIAATAFYFGSMSMGVERGNVIGGGVGAGMMPPLSTAVQHIHQTVLPPNALGASNGVPQLRVASIASDENWSPPPPPPRERTGTIDLDPRPPVVQSSVAAAAISAAAAAAAALDPSAQQFRFLVRILSSGARFHLEFERLLQSLQSAQYVAGHDQLDLEIVVDYPLGLRPPTIDQHNGDAELHREAVAAFLASPQYKQLKYEYELTLIIARKVAWDHGSLRVRVIDEAEAPALGGIFNLASSWIPSVSAGIAGAPEEWCIILRDTNVLAPLWFQAVKRMIASHFPAPGIAGEGATSASEARLDPESLWGLALEPSSMLLGLPADADKFDPERSVMQALKPFMPSTAATSTEPLLFYSQALLLGHPSAPLGGLVLRGSKFAQFTRWLGSGLLGPLLRKDANNTPASEDYGAPVLRTYARPSLGGVDPCVPGLVSNAWLSARMLDFRLAMVGVPGLANERREARQMEALHLKRMHDEWFLVNLVARFMYERQWFLIGWAPTNAADQGTALVSSASFVLSHTHQLSSTKTHAPHLNDDGTLDESGESTEFQPDQLFSLPPLAHQILQGSSPLWSASAASKPLRVIPSLFDFAMRATPLKAGEGAAKPAATVAMGASCELPHAVAKLQPPTLEPTPAQRALVLESARALTQPASKPGAASASTPAASASPASAPASSKPSDPESISSLLSAAESRSRTANLSLSRYIPGRDTDDWGMPWLVLGDRAFAVPTSDPLAALNKTIEEERKRWAEFEADWTAALERTQTQGAARLDAKRRQAALRAAHQASLGELEAERDRQKLIARLKKQLQKEKEKDKSKPKTKEKEQGKGSGSGSGNNGDKDKSKSKDGGSSKDKSKDKPKDNSKPSGPGGSAPSKPAATTDAADPSKKPSGGSSTKSDSKPKPKPDENAGADADADAEAAAAKKRADADATRQKQAKEKEKQKQKEKEKEEAAAKTTAATASKAVGAESKADPAPKTELLPSGPAVQFTERRRRR